MEHGILKNQLGSRLGLQGTTPNKLNGANPLSTLHYQSSITDNPLLEDEKLKYVKAKPSNQDLDGITPEKYLDNPPT